MANSPPPGAFDPNRAVLDRLAALEAAVKNLTNKTLNSAAIGSGGITVNGGRIVIQTSGGIQLPLGGNITDALNDIIFSADTLNGQRLSTPFLGVPAAAKWDGNDGAAFRAGGSVGDYVFQAAHCTAETTLWQGRIPQVVHSCAGYFASVGRVTGTTSTPTYRLYVNNSLVDTHTTNVYSDYLMPIKSITTITSFGSIGTPFKLTVQADVTSTDYFACTLYAFFLGGN